VSGPILHHKMTWTRVEVKARSFPQSGPKLKLGFLHLHLHLETCCPNSEYSSSSIVCKTDDASAIRTSRNPNIPQVTVARIVSFSYNNTIYNPHLPSFDRFVFYIDISGLSFLFFSRLRLS